MNKLEGTLRCDFRTRSNLTISRDFPTALNGSRPHELLFEGDAADFECN